MGGGKMRTVLFADDTEEVRTVSCAALQHGCTVVAARDGFEALFLAREHRDPIDLIDHGYHDAEARWARPLPRDYGLPSGRQGVVHLWVPCGRTG